MRKNISHFAPLYESNHEEGTKNGTKPKNPIISLRGKDKGSKNKGGQNKINEEGLNDRENEITVKVYDLNRDEELNGDFRTADHDDDSGSDN